MNIRNAKRTRGAGIDVEYEHPKFGWIPFTANENDVEPLGREIYAAAVGVAADADPQTPDELAAIEAAQKAAQDANAAKADAKLSALSSMSPAQVRAWVGANVGNLADARDVLATLAVAVSILSRRL